MARVKKERPLKKLIAIFVEGPTEKEYFEQLKQQKNLGGATAVRIDTLSGSGDYVDKAEKQIKSSPLFRKRNVTQKVLVYDANHASEKVLQSLFEKARRKGYDVAFSNVSFEVWLLAHFQVMTDKVISEERLVKLLSNHLNEGYGKGNPNHIAKILKGLESAHINTVTINDISFQRQATSVGKIIEGLL
ncbi:RloB family protein [Weissella cibaria]|uniref:RloB family protein n=2 Tax=Weissella cibaria TaxID=137591 RepID=UPI00223B8E2C|nr:RloB family protein [Weissella cibaria]MCT0021425.1 RloB domain-containing protein [Weissella cibaria]